MRFRPAWGIGLGTVLVVAAAVVVVVSRSDAVSYRAAPGCSAMSAADCVRSNYVLVREVRGRTVDYERLSTVSDRGGEVTVARGSTAAERTVAEVEEWGAVVTRLGGVPTDDSPLAIEATGAGIAVSLATLGAMVLLVSLLARRHGRWVHRQPTPASILLLVLMGGLAGPGSATLTYDAAAVYARWAMALAAGGFLGWVLYLWQRSSGRAAIGR